MIFETKINVSAIKNRIDAVDLLQEAGQYECAKQLLIDLAKDILANEQKKK